MDIAYFIIFGFFVLIFKIEWDYRNIKNDNKEKLKLKSNYIFIYKQTNKQKRQKKN